MRGGTHALEYRHATNIETTKDLWFEKPIWVDVFWVLKYFVSYSTRWRAHEELNALDLFEMSAFNDLFLRLLFSAQTQTHGQISINISSLTSNLVLPKRFPIENSQLITIKSPECHPATH